MTLKEVYETCEKLIAEFDEIIRDTKSPIKLRIVSQSAKTELLAIQVEILKNDLNHRTANA